MSWSFLLTDFFIPAWLEMSLDKDSLVNTHVHIDDTLFYRGVLPCHIIGRF